jgi:hypothetical protein
VDGAHGAAASGDPSAADRHTARRCEECHDVGDLRGGDDPADADAGCQAPQRLGLSDASAASISAIA